MDKRAALANHWLTFLQPSSFGNELETIKALTTGYGPPRGLTDEPSPVIFTGAQKAALTIGQNQPR